MSRRNFYATTALGLCLVVTPLSANADTPEDLDLFAPLVQPCIAAPGVDTCEEVRTVVQECAADLNFAECSALFEDPNAVFEDPEKLQTAQARLERTSAAIEDFPLETDVEPLEEAEPEETEVEVEAEAETEAEAAAEVSEAEPSEEAAEDDAGSSDADAEDLDESIRADAERTLLRGDENLMAHSAPEVLEGESPENGDDATAEDTSEAEEVIDAEAAEAQAEDTAATEAIEEVHEGEAAEAESGDATPAADEPEVIEAPEEAAEGEATEDAASDTEAETAAEAAPEVEEERTEAREEAEPVQQEEVERLRAAAEEMAEEAPELVIEEAPEEDFVAPVEEAPELDAEQQGALDRLLENPEVAAALAVFGTALATPERDDATEEEGEAPSGRMAAALAALERASRDPNEADDEDAADTAEAAEVIEDEITADEIRSSREDFVSRMALDFDTEQAAAPGRRDRRDLERAGLAALGALAVGMIVNQNRVVARSDERVVVDQGGGDLRIWRDDDTILREQGTTRRIERYEDGTTLSRWNRPDGSQIVTIRDVTGRILWRERVMADGTRIELVNDMREVTPIDVSVLPPPRTRELRISQRTDPELALAMLQEAEADARAVDRSFTLRQIRETYEVRQLLPLLSPEPITFETNRANVRPAEAPKLMQVGRLIERLVQNDPREVFLVEGHTDATGPAAFNLALSDRRAESVALALTEFFDIPPENLVIQGYGERHLRIPTLSSEERNRRVAIRRITPLLGL